MSERLEQIKARAEAATKGPWQRSGPMTEWPEVEVVSRDGRRRHIAFLGEGSGQHIPDADFIAASREDIPYLLEQLQAAEAERDIWWANHNILSDQYDDLGDALDAANTDAARLADRARALLDNLHETPVAGMEADVMAVEFGHNDALWAALAAHDERVKAVGE